MNIDILACPVTKSALTLMSLGEARAAMGVEQLVGRVAQPGFNAAPFGETGHVLLRSDGAAAYPVVNGIPVLLAPEVLTADRMLPPIDLHSPQYEEAYEEMDYYNKVGRQIAADIARSGSLDGQAGFSIQRLNRLHKFPPSERDTFPNPYDVWLGSRSDAASEMDCFRHLAPMHGKRVMQLGGSGDAVVRFLLAGAEEGLLVTPMIGEAHVAIAIAEVLGVADRLCCVIGVGEELPFRNLTFDAIFSGGCVHHMETDLAFPEINRILRPGGKFAAFDPWRAPLHHLGTKLLGKREISVHCRPLDSKRVRPLDVFAQQRAVFHGTLARYPMIVWNDKLRLPLSLPWAVNIARLDDLICNAIPGARRLGSSLALLATKSA